MKNPEAVIRILNLQLEKMYGATARANDLH